MTTDDSSPSTSSQSAPRPGDGSGATRTAVVLPWENPGGHQPRGADARLAEMVELAKSIGLEVVHTAVVPLRARRPSTLLGQGQVASLGQAVAEHAAELAVVDAALSPVQQRNLERQWRCKVIDRTGLILDIFGERARTREGAMQVELAHLQYQRSRLVRSWTHLGRQRGGFGFLGGPGETQIEADRRLIGERIARLKRELEEVRRTRGLHRDARRRVPFPVVALVGYTNAGKSTLFNAPTGAGVFARPALCHAGPHLARPGAALRPAGDPAGTGKRPLQPNRKLETRLANQVRSRNGGRPTESASPAMRVEQRARRGAQCLSGAVTPCRAPRRSSMANPRTSDTPAPQAA
jgi:GTP-binding GTPase Middle Region/GTP-binding GTPase N-terminal/50S ribosome-binding GTPase